MSCGTSCPCQFNCAMDTQGSKRDPISSEKAWLDFAVRYLSREAVCKGKGQETVWSSKCKPSWWDSTVHLPWKNPTANPKDTKEELMKKFDALNKHLREEGRFPKELEEEATLWAEGKYKELFLLTSLTSFRSKVTGLHAAVIEACSQADEMNAQVNQTLIRDIQSCLGATLTAVENLSSKPRRKNLKRPVSAIGKENTENASVKRCRLTADRKETCQVPVTVSKAASILPKQSKHDAVENSTKASYSNSLSDYSKDVVSQLQKVLKKRKELSMQKNISAVTHPKQQCLKQAVINTSPPCSQIVSIQSVDGEFSPPGQNSSSPIPVFVNAVVSENPPTKFTSIIPCENPVNVSLTEISAPQNSFLNYPENKICLDTSGPIVELQQVECNGYISQPDRMFLEDVINDDSLVLDKSADSSEIDFLLSPFQKENNTPLDEDLNENISSIENSPLSDDINSPDRGSRIQGGRVFSDANSHASEVSECSFSDSGCISDSSFVDSILSPEEQNQLLFDDDLEGFWSNFNNSSNNDPVDFSVADLENFVKDI